MNMSGSRGSGESLDLSISRPWTPTDPGSHLAGGGHLWGKEQGSVLACGMDLEDTQYGATLCKFLSSELHQTNGITVLHLIDKPLSLELGIQKSH